MLFGKRIQEEHSESPNYWISFSDFAMSFLISFIILSTLMLAYTNQQKEEIEDRLKLAQERYDVRATIKERLDEVFADDPNIADISAGGVITLKQQVIEFYEGSEVLKNGHEYIQEFYDKYIYAIKTATSKDGKINYYNEGYIERIIIEGHINRHNDMQNTEIADMNLSQKRAFTIYSLLYNKFKDDEILRQKIQAVGRGPYQPYVGKAGEVVVDQEKANRRVEFHFTLNEAKITEEQMKIYKGETK